MKARPKPDAAWPAPAPFAADQSPIEHAPIPIARVEGAQHVVCEANPAFCRLVGLPREQLVGRAFAHALPKLVNCLAVLGRVFRTASPERHTERDPASPQPAFWSFSTWPILEQDHVVGAMIQVAESSQSYDQTLAMNEALMLGSLRQHELTEAADSANALLQAEIAERRQIQEALHRAQAQLTERAQQLEVLLAKYTDLYDFAPVGYMTLDQNGSILEANLAAASMLGVSRANLTLSKRQLGAFVSRPERDTFSAFLSTTFALGFRETCEVRLITGGDHPVDARMEAIAFESRQACRVAVTDITAHKRAEADRLILNKLASTGILAGGIAHDFNNLLTVILLNLELAERLCLPGEALARHLEEAKQTSLLARGLTAQLVTFSDGGAPVRRVLSLSGMIQESVRPALSGSEVRCEFSLAGDLWPADVDEGQIGQVIRNLVLNAREAMPDGGVVFVRSENVVLTARDHPPLPGGKYVRVSIADQGSGIAGDVLPKIFDPYFSTKQRGPQKGMGLGLTICHAIVQKHGGTITVQSELGVGTTFDIFLPAAEAWRGGARAGTPAAMPWHGRVLVMDDDEPVRKLVGLALRGMGHTVELAEHGQMALAMYEAAKRLGHPIELVILDLTIRGGMGGQETMQALLKLDPGVKAIAMSGYVHDPVITDPLRFGFAGSIAKPFEHKTVQELLARIMGRVPVGQLEP